MRNLIPAADILQREVRTVNIPLLQLGRVRPSLANDNFDTLRWCLAPTRRLASHAEVGMSISVTSDITETTSRFWGSETLESYRISVIFPQHRTVVVMRTARDVLVCVQAISMVYPELLVPAPLTEGDIDVITVDVLCACIQHNIQYLKAFLPVVFFLLEDTALGMKHCNDVTEAALALLKSSVRVEEKKSWWSSSKRPVSSFTIHDDIDFLSKMKGLKSPAGNILKHVRDVLQASQSLQEATLVLSGALEEEEKAVSSVLTELYGQTMENILSTPPWEAPSEEIAVSQPFRVAQVSSLLDMLRPPANYILAFEDGLASLIRRMALLSRTANQHEDKYVVAWARLCVDRIDQSVVVQSDFAKVKRKQALLQLCVLIHCLTRHLFE